MSLVGLQFGASFINVPVVNFFGSSNVAAECGMLLARFVAIGVPVVYKDLKALVEGETSAKPCEDLLVAASIVFLFFFFSFSGVLPLVLLASLCR